LVKGQSSFSFRVDPETGKVVAIESDYLKLTQIGTLPARTVQELEADGSMSEALIPADINPPQDPSLIFPRDNDGKIPAIIERIYPLYVVTSRSESRGGQSSDGRMGALLQAFYYGLVEIPGVYVSGDPPITLPDYYLLFKFPADRGE
jgi:hypothetical protein